jgi:hypothetical protein
MRTWLAALAALVAVRLAIPLAALAAEGTSLPGLPRYDFVALTGDATGFYAAAREFMAAWGRLNMLLLAALALAAAVAAALLVRAWRRRPELRAWLLSAGALGFALLVAAAITQMSAPGAAVFGWPLVWSLPMLPYRALGGPLDPEIAYGFGLTLSLAASAVSVVATAYAGLYATGRRAVGLLAATLFTLWPFLTGLIAGSRAWENGSWQVDVGLHLYTEPLSTALVATALALLLHPRLNDLHLASAGVALGLGAAVKLSNGLIAALGLLVLSAELGARRALPYLVGSLSFAPVVIAYWPLGYVPVFDNPASFPEDAFAARYLLRSWTESLLFRPLTLLIILPVALVGIFAVRRQLALPLLLVWTFLNAAFYSFYAVTPLHPRFLHASLPSLFVLWAAGAAAIALAVAPAHLSASRRRRPTRTA